MPELPEVETIKLQLEKYLVGRRIEKIGIRVPKMFPEGKEKLLGGKIIGLRRFGKVLVVDLDNGFSFLVHLKLTGQLIFSAPEIPNRPNRFTHIIFYLDNKAKLFFNDARKFGWIKIAKSLSADKAGERLKAENEFIEKLGLEPFVGQASSGQAPLTLEKFREILSKTKRAIKIVLMDQEKISGLGNIYTNEALYAARINPRRSAVSLNQSEVSLLFKSIEKVLKDGLKYQGASDQWYVTAEGKKGQYQEHFLVYGREGKNCLACGQKIQKIALGGRGTYLCPACQK